MSPSQFDALGDEDKAKMIAFETVAGTIESYHVEMVSKKDEKMDPMMQRDRALEARSKARHAQP